MSSGRRGRGGGDRGGRGARGSANPFRGSATRGGKANGLDALTQATWKRDGQQDSSRGGAALRGGASARGDRPDTRNNSRGRGGNKTTFARSTSKAAFTPKGPMNSTNIPEHEYQKRFKYLESIRPQVKAQLIAERKMNPDGPMKLEDAVEKYGYCTDMCPELERVRRIVQDSVWAPECTEETQQLRRGERVPDEKRMVKLFHRSAAGEPEELASEVRDPPTCFNTLRYLWKRIDEDGMDFVYQWIWDRSRMVRRDLNKIKPQFAREKMICLEECARFHLVSAHWMAKSIPKYYDSLTDHGNDMREMHTTFLSLKHRYQDNVKNRIESQNQAEFMAYDIILSLHHHTLQLSDVSLEPKPDAPPEDRPKIPPGFENDRGCQLAWRIREVAKAALSTKGGSTKQNLLAEFWNLLQLPETTYLMACAAEISFVHIRHDFLKYLRRLYNPGIKETRKAPAYDWTMERLVEVLGFDSIEQAEEFCAPYGLEFYSDHNGVEYLDRESFVPDGVFEAPTLKQQMFSQKFVESKRPDLNFSVIIEAGAEHENGGEDSLFIPEGPIASKATFPGIGNTSMITNGSTATTQENGTHTLNPFARAFQPSPGTANGNHFLNNANATPAKVNPFNTAGADGKASPASSTPATVHPGLFDPSKNSIQFASPNGSNISPFPSATPEKSISPSLSNASNLFATKSTSGPSSTPSANTLTDASIATTSAEPVGQSVSQSSTPWSLNGLASNATRWNETPASTSQASPAPSPLFQPQSPTTASNQEEERRRVEEQRKEQQRLADEKRRILEEQERQAREAAREAEQRRQIQEQEQKRRIREEQERKVREAQERQAREEQQRRAQQEAERRALAAREQAYDEMAQNLLLDDDGGLLMQFLENMVSNTIRDTAQKLEEKRLEELAENMYQQRRLAFTRAVCAKWWHQIQKKKKKAESRRRRQQLKVFRAEAGIINGQVEPVSVPPSHEVIQQTNGVSSGFKKPESPASVQRPKEQPKTGRKKAATVSYRNDKVEKGARKEATRTSIVGINGASVVAANGDYSEAYYNSKAPIDRTETDWFKLRAMGIDPSKHRKRSFGSVSSDDEEEPDVETKRARRSTSSSFRRSLPPPSTDEERLARFRAVKEAFNRGSATPRPLDNGRLANGNSKLLIAQARELLADTPTPQHSPPTTQPDFRQSAPRSSSGFTKPVPQLSMFGRSIGASLPDERPAYWARQSRFVPKHLYGKGPDAVRAYRDEVNGRPPAGSKPLVLSSPIATQQSFFPTESMQHEYGDWQEQVFEDADGEDEGDAVNDYDGIEYDEVDEDEEVMYSQDEEQVEEYYDEDEDEEMSDDDATSEQFAQKPGGTQDDAIELSD